VLRKRIVICHRRSCEKKLRPYTLQAFCGAVSTQHKTRVAAAATTTTTGTYNGAKTIYNCKRNTRDITEEELQLSMITTTNKALKQQGIRKATRGNKRLPINEINNNNTM
jgi:hypothetical protein